MNKINYSQIYNKLTNGLSSKVKEIFDRRFGVKSNMTETLESIGNSMGITRERVRQIEEAGFNFIRKNRGLELKKALVPLEDYFNQMGGFRKEEAIFNDFGGSKNKPYILFLLTIGEQFSRICGKRDYHYFWANTSLPKQKIKETLNLLVSDLQKYGSPLAKEEFVVKFAQNYNLTEKAVFSYLDISKKIQTNKEGKLGLVDWPEIKPKSVKDKAYLVFKKHQKPLHFREITKLIDELGYENNRKKTHPQTVHNELIKDNRFVLVGRGIYALGEWGYVPGTIQDIIEKILKEKPHLNNKEDLVKEVLSQRLVEKNTILIKLNDKKYFHRDEQGRYFPIKSQTA